MDFLLNTQVRIKSKVEQSKERSSTLPYQRTMRLLIIYLMYMHKKDLALNKLQGLICHKIQPTI